MSFLYQIFICHINVKKECILSFCNKTGYFVLQMCVKV